MPMLKDEHTQKRPVREWLESKCVWGSEEWWWWFINKEYISRKLTFVNLGLFYAIHLSTGNSIMWELIFQFLIHDLAPMLFCYHSVFTLEYFSASSSLFLLSMSIINLHSRYLKFKLWFLYPFEIHHHEVHIFSHYCQEKWYHMVYILNLMLKLSCF